MKRNINQQIYLFLMLIIFSCSLVHADYLNYDQAYEIFNKGYIEVTGTSEENQSRYRALRSATVNAQRDLLEQFKGLTITGSSTVEIGMLEEDKVKTSVEGFLRGAQKCGERYDTTHRYAEVCMRLNLRSKGQKSIYKNIFPILQSEKIISSDNQWKPSNKNSLHQKNGDSLIIDIKGQNFMPALNNRILNEKENIIYGPSHVIASKLAEKGIAGFTNSLDKAKAQLKSWACKNPLIIKAYKIKNKTDVIIRQDDALKVVSTDQKSNYLAQANVFFVIR